MFRVLVHALILVCSLFLSTSALASNNSEQDFASDAAVLRDIHQGLTGAVSATQVRNWQQQVQGIVSSADTCTKNQQDLLSNVDKSLHILGPAVPDEPASLVQLRSQLSAQKTDIGGKLAACKVLYSGGNVLLSDLRDKETRIHTRRLLQHGPDLLAQIRELAALPKNIWQREERFWLHPDRLPLFANAAWQGAWGLGIAVYVLALVLRRQSDHALRELYPLSAVVACGVASVFLGVLYPITVLLLVSLTAYILSTWLSRSMLRHLAEVPARAEREAVMLRVLWRPLRFIITFGVFLLVYQSLDPQGSALLYHHTALLTAIHTVILSTILWVLWRARRFTFLKDWRWLQVMLFTVAIALILLNFIGFTRLADYLSNGFVISLVAILLARVVGWFLEDVWGDEDKNNGQLPRLIRRHLGLDEQAGTWLSWLRLFSHMLLWTIVLAVVLIAWGLSSSGFYFVWQVFVRGFTVGNFHIQPFRWLIAIALLIFLFNLNQWIQNRLVTARGIFRHFDSGSRHSVLAIFRYIGFIIAILLSLSTAGVALHNLAIIAGALSVGIGFGLQNIVNNFVSGIILLLERPIRVGDWVRVGTTEGYVQRLSIRSTLILTFDRTEVFVPNSELISGQVTNWTYSNNVLRLMIPLRVHHSADIDEVRSVLEAVGQKHPEVLQDDPRGIPPTALLLDVTENALVFYLRVYIADCNNSFMIQTELRAQAVEALHRGGVRLAHQQQDLYFPERTVADDRPSAT